jgi:hypothetical protein
MKNSFNIDEYINVHTITDQEKIRIAKSFPKLSKLPKFNPLEPVAIAKFKGDKLPKDWSVNDKFIIDCDYPIYYNFETDIDFAIGSDGVGYKVLPIAWKYIIQI